MGVGKVVAVIAVVSVGEKIKSHCKFFLRMVSMNGFNSSPCTVLLPEDIIFLIIAPMVCDLSNSCILDSRGGNHASDFMVSKTGREMMMLQLPCCWKKPDSITLCDRDRDRVRDRDMEDVCMCRSGGYWCRYHHPIQYGLCQNVQFKWNSGRSWLYDPPADEYCVIQRGVIATQAYHLSEGITVEWIEDGERAKKVFTLPQCDLISTFQQIFKNSKYGISHVCCHGNGIMYGEKIDLFKK